MPNRVYLTKVNKNRRNTYKRNLTRDETVFYEQLVEALSTYRTRVRYQYIEPEGISKVLNAVEADYPEIAFYLVREKYSYTYISGKGKSAIYELQLTYRYPIAEVRRMLTDLESFIEKEIYPYIEKKNCRSEKDIVSAVYEYLAGKLSYSKEKNEKDEFPYHAYTLEILLRDVGVCKGVSLAMVYILDKFDIDCIYITGTTEPELDVDEPTHAWNMICLDGTFYHVDLTGDLQQKNFNFFLLNDKEMRDLSHYWNLNKFPKAV